MTGRLVFYAPSDQPVGGIAKLLDYAVHAARHGRESLFVCERMRSGAPSSLFSKPYFLAYGQAVTVCHAADLQPLPTDIVVFSLPSSHLALKRLYRAAGIRPLDFVHLVQNVRVANTAFDNGYSYRLLPKRLHRLAITEDVRDAILPFVEDRDLLHVIPHGFDFDFFARAPERSDPPVLHFNRFKSDFGERVLAALSEAGLTMEVIVTNKGQPWPEMQANYKRSSLFLSTPLPEEGLYLPGLEAMAAGNLVVTSDAIGNRFYCDFGTNCLEIPYEDIPAAVARISWALDNWTGAAFDMRVAAYAKSESKGMEPEFSGFGRFLSSSLGAL